MILNNTNNENLLRKNSKRYLDYCEKFFIERISADFSTHLEIIGNEAKKNIAALTSFSDKQSLNDFIQKSTTKKQMLSLDFKMQLNKSFNEQFVSGNLNNLKLNWINAITGDANHEKELDSVQKLTESINKSLGKELSDLLNKTNFLLNDKKNIFDAAILTQSLFMVLKNHFQNHKTITLGLEYFTLHWPPMLVQYYVELNKYLNNNEVKEQETKPVQTNEQKSLILDFNSFIKNATTFEEADTLTSSEKKFLAVPVFDKPPVEYNSVKEKNNSEPTKYLQFGEEFNHFEKKQNPFPESSQSNQIESKIEDTNEPISSKYNLEIKHSILESEDVFASQYINNDFVDINELLFKSIVHKKTSLNLSNITNNPYFINTINKIQKQITNLPTSHFSNGKTFHSTLLNDLLKNKILLTSMNANDIFIFKLLIKTYDFLFANEILPLEQKVILYKTQFWVLQIALAKKSFLYDQNHPGRIFISYLLNNESLLNINLVKKLHEIIISIGQDYERLENIDVDFFINIINQFKYYTQRELNRQVIAMTNHINNIQELEKKDYFQERILLNVRKISNKTTYAPLKCFIEQSWTTSFLNVFLNKLTYEIVDSSDFVRELPLDIKLVWHQSSLLFDMMIVIAENNDLSSIQVEKMKSFFVKIIEGLSKICVELNIEHDHIKSIFNLLKARFEAPLKTSNPVILAEIIKKNESLEKDFILESNKFVTNLTSSEKTNNEIIASNFNFENFIIIDEWYHFNKNNYKLIYASSTNKNFILINLENNTISHYNKMKLWYIIKSKTFTNISKKYSHLNFLDYLLKSTHELKKEYEEN